MSLHMKMFLTHAVVVFGLCQTLHADDSSKPASSKNAADKNGFVRLYNGKNLEGWAVQGGNIDSWKADGELLSCIKSGGGWLRTKKQYSDFILKLEYKIPADGNSGVGLRFPGKGEPAFSGMELQILDDDADKYKGIKKAQFTGSIYYQAAAKRGATNPPGQWNKYEITCAGRHVKVVLNGKVINDANLDEYTKGKGGHTPLADRPGIGYVGMQSHGSRVDFRNIRIKDLTTTAASGLSYYDIVKGNGKVVPAGARVTVHYTGRLASGKKFDSSRDSGKPLTFLLTRNSVIAGWNQGIPGMKVGGRRKLIIPAVLGYGKEGYGNLIPPDAMLIFDVEVKAIR